MTGKFPAVKGSFGVLTLDDRVQSEILPSGDTLHGKWRWLPYIPALFLGYGIIFLEAWPYWDLSPLVVRLKRVWQFGTVIKEIIKTRKTVFRIKLGQIL